MPLISTLDTLPAEPSLKDLLRQAGYETRPSRHDRKRQIVRAGCGTVAGDMDCFAAANWLAAGCPITADAAGAEASA